MSEDGSRRSLEQEIHNRRKKERTPERQQYLDQLLAGELEEHNPPEEIITTPDVQPHKNTPPESKETKAIFSLTDILDNEIHPSEETQNVIATQALKTENIMAQQDERALAPDARFWNQHETDIHLQSILKKHLHNSSLIDLGGGSGEMMDIMSHTGLSTYINVDRFTKPYEIGSDAELMEPTPPSNPFEVTKTQDITPHLTYVHINADMLDFASHMRPGVYNITLNGIDKRVIQDEQYHRLLARELLRVTEPGSLIFGLSSDISQYLEDEATHIDTQIRRAYQPPSTSDIDTFAFEVIG